MSSKLPVVLFLTAVLVLSVTMTTLPAANALTRNTFDDSHTTARLGNSKVCGDHLCAAGEHEKMSEQINNAQRGGQSGQMTTPTTTPSAPTTPSMSDVCAVVKDALTKAQVDSAITTLVMSKLGC